MSDFSSRLQQKWLETSIDLQADVLKIERLLPNLSDKEAEIYNEWIKTLRAASKVYSTMAQMDRSWIIPLNLSRPSTKD